MHGIETKASHRYARAVDLLIGLAISAASSHAQSSLLVYGQRGEGELTVKAGIIACKNQGCNAC